jgi:hypothetical protein
MTKLVVRFRNLANAPKQDEMCESVLAEKLEVKRPLVRHGRRWKDNIGRDFKTSVVRACNVLRVGTSGRRSNICCSSKALNFSAS